jgi:hypothetical protein
VAQPRESYCKKLAISAGGIRPLRILTKINTGRVIRDMKIATGSNKSYVTNGVGKMRGQ